MKIYIFLICIFKLVEASQEVEFIESIYKNQNNKNHIIYTDFYDSLHRGQSIKQLGFWYNSDIFKIIYRNYYLSINKSEYSLIPKIIHFIWLGSNPPAKVLAVINSWEKFHPDWEICIWNDEKVKSLDWSNQKYKKAFDEAKSWAEKADFLRLQILHQYGGIYSDTDMICVSSFDPLLSKGLSFFAGLEKPGDYYISNLAVCNALIGCAPQHSIISKAMNNQKTLSEAPNYPCNIRTGPGPLSRAIEEFLITSFDENVLILPCTYFYPSYYDITLSVLINKYNSSFPFRKEETMAIHLWDNSWNKP
jgi:mannosyltransferase OCH1-like enzyme